VSVYLASEETFASAGFFCEGHDEVAIVADSSAEVEIAFSCKYDGYISAWLVNMTSLVLETFEEANDRAEEGRDDQETSIGLPCEGANVFHGRLALRVCHVGRICTSHGFCFRRFDPGP